jgi:hypothetical protein
MPERSIVVILSIGGSVLDRRALDDLPGAEVVKAEFAWAERASCAAVTLQHECSCPELALSLRPWAAGRGWSVTVAPLGGRG